MEEEIKTQIATIALAGVAAGGNVTLLGQNVLDGAVIVNMWQNTNATLSSGTAYTGEFELTIYNKKNTAIYDRIPNNAIQNDAGSQNYIKISFDNISLDKSFVRFLQNGVGQFIQLLVEYYYPDNNEK